MADSFLRDLRHAFRMFAASPAFSLAAVPALTMGIGVNTAIFSVVNAVLLRPLPFPEPDRIVYFTTTTPNGSFPGSSPAKFRHFRAQTEVTQHASAFAIGLVNFTGGSFPEQLRSARVSADFFALFGAVPVAGRTFSPEEDRPGGGNVAVLSHGLWATRYNRDPGVVGQAISLDGQPFTIVGVLGDVGLADVLRDTAQIFTPFQLDPTSSDQGHYFQTAGRLKPGVSLEQGKARLQASTAGFNAMFPNALGNNQGFSVDPMGALLVRNARSSLLVLTGAVGFVLLIACANVANLLLVRATGRRRELAVRAALGGTRTQIARQVLTESLVLSLAGGALGLAVGTLGIRALLAVNTANLPRIGDGGALVAVDWRVMLFTFALAIGTGLLFGVLPALQSSRTNVTDALKEGGGRGGSGGGQGRTRAALVVTEVALALTLLIGSALLIRSAVALGRVDPGFNANNVLTMRMSLTGPRFQTSADVDAFVRQGVERLRAVPGVTVASTTCCVPLEDGLGLPFVISGRALADSPFHGGGQWVTIGADYFDVFQIPVTQGRTFTDRDDGLAPAVVIINEAMAKQYWPDKSPVGERLVIGRGIAKEFATEREREIVGVVGNTRDGGLNRQPGPAMYVPSAQLPDAVSALSLRMAPIGWMVRTAGAPSSMSAAVQAALREVTGLPVSNVRSMAQVVSVSTSRQRFNMWLMSIFGASALVLAAIGIYGLMAYTVEQRTRELGIRLALGATPRAILMLIVRHGLVVTLSGVAAGLAGAFVLTRFMQSLLFGVSAADPLTFGGIAAALTVVALAASYLPARRAARIDPVISLRSE